jgi:hypothetical protein
MRGEVAPASVWRAFQGASWAALLRAIGVTKKSLKRYQASPWASAGAPLRRWYPSLTATRWVSVCACAGPQAHAGVPRTWATRWGRSRSRCTWTTNDCDTRHPVSANYTDTMGERECVCMCAMACLFA